MGKGDPEPRSCPVPASQTGFPLHDRLALEVARKRTLTFSKPVAAQGIESQEQAPRDIRRVGGCPTPVPGLWPLSHPCLNERRWQAQGFTASTVVKCGDGRLRRVTPSLCPSRRTALHNTRSDSLTFANDLPYADLLAVAPGPTGSEPRPSTPESGLPTDHPPRRADIAAPNTLAPYPLISLAVPSQLDGRKPSGRQLPPRVRNVCGGGMGRSRDVGPLVAGGRWSEPVAPWRVLARPWHAAQGAAARSRGSPRIPTECQPNRDGARHG